MIIFLTTLLILETAVLVIVANRAVKFGILVLKTQDAVENSLGVLDERYASISKVLQIPLFYDSPEIKRVHDDIKASRDSILYVANLISNVEEVEE